jgi:hypothetical protein
MAGRLTFFKSKFCENLNNIGWRIVWATNRPNFKKFDKNLKS